MAANRMSRSRAWYGRALLPLALIAVAFSEGTASAQGALVNGDIHTGTIATPGQVDTWSFTAARGDLIALTIAEIVTDPDPGFMPWMQLQNHDTGAVVITVSGAVAAHIAVTPQATAYDVFVRDSNVNRPGTALGSYTLTLVKSPGSPVVHAGDQGGAMTNGANHTGSIYVGDLDAWTFTAAKDDYITLALAEVESGIDPLFLPAIRLIDPTGDVIQSAQGALAAQVAARATLTGTYTVLISDSAVNREPSHAGDYILRMVKTNAPLTVPDGDQGGPMTNGANHAGTISIGDLDGWTFTASKDDYIALSIGEVLEIDPDFRPWIRLLGPDGQVIGNPQGALAAQIAATAPLSGLYTVVVADSASNVEPLHAGNYILTLFKTSAPVTVPIGDEGGPMLSGANYGGAITPGDLDPYTFTAAQGDYIAIKVGEIVPSGIDPLFVPWIRLIGPNGAVVLSVTGSLTAAIAANATLSGTYSILVADSGLNQEPSHASNYVLTMFRAPGTFVVPPGDHGGVLRNNVTRSGTLYSGDLDEWTFLGTSGQTVNVTITDVSDDPGFVPSIRLIGPTGSVVLGASGATTATIIVPLSATGVYTVVVADSDLNREGSAIGNYTLTATGIDPNVCDSGAVAGITIIRATDVVSLRDRINSVRGHFGAPLFTFTDTNLAGAPVKAMHFEELRSALQGAYAAAGQALPVYTDPVLMPEATLIKAVHVNQLCTAVAFLE